MSWLGACGVGGGGGVSKHIEVEKEEKTARDMKRTGLWNLIKYSMKPTFSTDFLLMFFGFFNAMAWGLWGGGGGVSIEVEKEQRKTRDLKRTGLLKLIKYSTFSPNFLLLFS